ncbi:HNH endonuclease [Rhizobium sp. VS19-DR104.2]|uniref:HNH endonuclease n=1 Tax=unclassified Rhizobium TaxID=2613769 RepID=UPI001CC7B6A3|nr:MULTISPECIES: HNH endonuclease [unclassified Rhizobium]MBZ5761528.1 HNH endonuclease [Rhizobium sp. VS19-DR96]MBZ5767476.1 HNH endonuclease [Rhizobium sp. VS19-DR129.2]MBZ5775075.1 HNH endonuclease [Rhizobium sp. VS19-DRK62.2]MBZ5785960.1 HNH endonuclease [Rhizobium sp. VS19-DR121]MBZ5803386.1 HNH endonuclease [Rhizobium sp. VS19-DR181]
MRDVPEWIGRTDNTAPSEACKRRILDRQDERCAITGVALRDGVRVHWDHKVPLWLGGENREGNLQAITEAAHKAKTATEATVRAKINRNRAKRHGNKKGSGLTHPTFKRLMDGTVVRRDTGEIVK